MATAMEILPAMVGSSNGDSANDEGDRHGSKKMPAMEAMTPAGEANSKGGQQSREKLSRSMQGAGLLVLSG